MSNLSRYLTIGSAVAIARITVSQLGIVFPQTMGAPALAFSWLILAAIGLAALWGVMMVWREAEGKLEPIDFMGIAGLVAVAIIFNLILQGVGIWLAA